LYDTLGDHVASGAPVISPGGGTFKDYTTVTITPPIYYQPNALHYTLDGSEPTAASPVYGEPLQLSGSATLRAAEIEEGASAGQSVSAVFDIDDRTAPKITSAKAVGGIPSVTVQFSKPVDKGQAEDPANYRFTPDLNVTKVSLSDDGLQAAISLSAAPQRSTAELSVSGIHDLSPRANLISQASVPLSIDQQLIKIDSFEANGKGLEKPIEGLPVKGTDAWTMNCWVRADVQPDDRTVIAGFGRSSDSASSGSGRYLTKFPGGLHFWSRNADADTNAKLDLHRWQMLTVTYDGTTLKVYKNGRSIGSQDVALADDESVIRLAPLDPWDNQRRFVGSIRGFAIWRGALNEETIKALAAARQR
jgi:alpha-mannosidase